MSYELLLNDAHGIYVPQMFAEEYFGFDGVDQSDMEICRAGPEHKPMGFLSIRNDRRR
jgi:hypothetical protein